MLQTSGSAAAVLAASSKSSSGAGFVNLLFLFVIIGAVFLFMRRSRARQRNVSEARNNVAPGVEVVTTAGLIATVVDGDDETVTLEIAPGVHSKFVRQAIARVVVPPSEEATSVEEPGPIEPSNHEPTNNDHPDDAPPEGNR